MPAKKMSAKAKRAPSKKKPGTPQSPKYCPKKSSSKKK
jgi:hypothetical protein